MTLVAAEKVTVTVPDPTMLIGVMVVWIPGSKSEEFVRLTIDANLFIDVTVTVTFTEAPPALSVMEVGRAESRKSGPLTNTLTVVT